jgi:hypothetical protein
LSYPKWRHHPTLESKIVTNWAFEESQTPDEDGWRDDRNFSSNDEPIKVKGKPGPKPKVKG